MKSNDLNKLFTEVDNIEPSVDAKQRAINLANQAFLTARGTDTAKPKKKTSNVSSINKTKSPRKTATKKPTLPTKKNTKTAAQADISFFNKLRQGFSDSSSPTGKHAKSAQSSKRTFAMSHLLSFENKRVTYGAVASACTLVFGVFMVVNDPSPSSLIPDGITVTEINELEEVIVVDAMSVAGSVDRAKRDLGAPVMEMADEPTAPQLQRLASSDMKVDPQQPFLKKVQIADNVTEAIRTEHRDNFETFSENPVKQVKEEPVSTFSIDVDTASYSFVRRQLNTGILPSKNAVRAEEMINYFDYQYPLPKDIAKPFYTSVSVTDSPWKAGNKLVHIGIKGYDVKPVDTPKSNIVFLLDVSGSMSSPDKLPLVKQSMSLLLDRLNPSDTVAIAVYAGAAGIVLEPTQAKEKQKILNAMNNLNAGGSTAGAEGIKLAYQLAEANLQKDGVNRVILATDGDFNVGIHDTNELKGFIERKRESGVFLSILGFGTGNYNDQLMQALAQNGNGTAAYIDTLSEAQKVLVHEANSTLFNIAKDVKIQMEFNPNTVAEYRLIGYETRALNREDFNNDKVDAGDIGSGHSVTAIYEITPVQSDSKLVDDSRYAEKPEQTTTETAGALNEYGFLKLRYKLPDEDKSKLLSTVVPSTNTVLPKSLQQEVDFSIAVASFAQLLKGGKYTGEWRYDDALALAQKNKGEDLYGYRTEFVQLIRKAKISSAL